MVFDDFNYDTPLICTRVLYIAGSTRIAGKHNWVSQKRANRPWFLWTRPCKQCILIAHCNFINVCTNHWPFRGLQIFLRSLIIMYLMNRRVYDVF